MGTVSYPGDDIIPDAVMIYDQKRTVRAQASDVYPWIIQLGKQRAGWYLTSRWERLLPRSWLASRTIVPAFQELAVGDRVPDYGGKDDYFDVISMDHPRSLVYQSDRYGTTFTWAILLHESSDANGSAQTTVHLRFRGRIKATGVRKMMIVWGGGVLDRITTAPMLAGLAERVEKSE